MVKFEPLKTNISIQEVAFESVAFRVFAMSFRFKSLKLSDAYTGQ